MESTRNQLIDLLARNSDRFISGQMLSEHLNITRSAIWKHMKELEKDGYVIEGVSKKGYRIIRFPDKVSENTIKWGLDTEWLGNTIIHKEQTTSTQHIAHQAAQNGAAHGTIIVADEQTQGKGRLQRPWHSAKNLGIWLSIIIRPSILPYLAPQLTLMTATVLADVLHNKGIEPKIKWPNDILINQSKVAGILTEMQAEQDQIQYIVIGIGMNVNHKQHDLPEDVNRKATSLTIETNKSWDINKLIQDILKQFEDTYADYIDNGFIDIKKNWENYGFRIGKPIYISTLKEKWAGKFLGIAEDGALLTTDKNGDTCKIYSADIDWLV
ncbi:biotin--[acetyl-CoA-carboxylase] ligase [Ornithinibacillus halophilus]|uniref:Bifunctional ligase/repressor BirA n=1 Tax=Ornithinibacillus halophilus TaxID=930117 RepID=A0A1M5CNE9_9BACI|nr:biotin--[acetyl-CoA-carboxylase] ligase [Ornithinibacillus halophilus]SHF56186.1 BirA family transcriptional regulator, biotin operon repressor / biotin-[acetyl-CoA-carboxylase] ligase [Ornithinibacillus halophilus]